MSNRSLLAAAVFTLAVSAAAHPESPASVSRRAAEEGIALLKNDGATLPFAKGSSVALFGPLDVLMCGGGSSQVKTPYFTGLPKGLSAEGFAVSRGEDCAATDNGIVVITRYSCEGKDVKDEAFDLSGKDLKAVEDAKAKCGKVAVVVSAGHLVNLKPLKDDPRVGAILFAWYPGIEGGLALARIVSGAVNPSGRLADTMAEKVSDWPSNGDFRADKDHFPYSEGTDVGYRYFNRKARDRIVYPFGHGLSYTTFSESAPRLSADGREVSVDVRNTGSRSGRHSVLYFENGELSAYAKTKLLAPGEGETLTMRPYRPLPKLPARVPDEIDARADEVVRSLTLEQQVELCSAQPPAMPRGTAGIANLPAFGVPNAQTSDGPNGIRSSRPATCFPASALLAQTFDDALLYEVGRALGEEAASNKVDILLGPGLNIHRHPLCGRNFEYFSEDPLLSGKLAAAYVRGVQSTGVAATLKHFCCNNREWKRGSCSSDIDGRTLREIYLKGFEIAVKEGCPRCVMTAYNKINGTFAGESAWLVDGILRGEWGFDGMVMTDWRAGSQIYRQIAAGVDVNMPYGYPEKVALAIEKARCGELSTNAVFASAKRVVREALLSRRAKAGDFGPRTRVAATGETVVPAKAFSCISSTWTSSAEDRNEGWCHTMLGQDPRGNDTFVQFELDVERGGEYGISARAKTADAPSRLSFEVCGVESPGAGFAAVDTWETLGPVRVKLPAGKVALKVWFRDGAKFDWSNVPKGVALARLIIEE